jgi:hypothetical protein
VLLPVGETFENAGSVVSALYDASNGKYKDAGITIGTGLLFNTAGVKIEGLEKLGKITSVQKTILGAATSTVNKLTDIAIDKSKKDKDNDKSSTDENINSPPVPKLDDIPQMQQDNTRFFNIYQ